MIELKNVYFKYAEDFILKNINLQIKEGSFTAIIGANGSGKTTLAKHFNALLLPAKGDALIDGFNTKQNEFEARKRVGLVFQNFEDQLIHSIVEEDIAFGLENLGFGSDKIKSVAEGTLNKLKIYNLAKKNVNMLSAGQKQLVALAGVLAMKPKYIVFDEPTTNLDIKNKKNIMDVIKELNKNGIGVILVTNVLDDVKYANDIVILKNGSILFDNKKSKLNKNLLKQSGLDD